MVSDMFMFLELLGHTGSKIMWIGYEYFLEPHIKMISAGHLSNKWKKKVAKEILTTQEYTHSRKS